MRFRFTLSTNELSTSFPGLSEFENADPGNEAWTLGSTPSVTPTTSRLLRGAIGGGVQDMEYQIDFDLDIADLTGGAHNLLVRIRLYDSTFTTYVDDTTAVFFTNGNKTGFVNLTPSFAPAYIVFLALQSSGSGASVTINSYSGSSGITMSDSLEITEPDGWKDATLKLERHPKYHSLVEHFEGDFIFYGQNQFVNGGINYIIEKVRYFGVDVTINILIELALNDVDYETVFTGQLAVPEQKAMVDNKLKCNVIRDDFWTKFIKRVDTPVNLQAGYSLDGEAVTVLDSVNVSLLPQKLQQKSNHFNTSYYLFILNINDYFQLDFDTVIFDEINTKYNYPITTNTELPFEIMSPEYSGEYRIESVMIWSAKGLGEVSDPSWARPGSNISIYVQINDDAPIAFSKVNDDTLGVPATRYSYDDTHTLQKGDFVRVYGVLDSQAALSVPAYYLFGADNVGVNNSVGPFVDETLSADSYLYITAQTEFPKTNAEGFLLHDAAGLICDRIISRDEAFYSELLGSQQTLYEIYEQDGCLWNHVLLRGLQIRQYSLLEKAFFISFKQWWEGADPIFNLGLGYETRSVESFIGPNPSFAALSTFENSGSGIAWSTGANPSLTLDNGEEGQLLRGVITNGYADIEYTVNYDLDVASVIGVDFFTLRIRLYDSSMSSFVNLGSSVNFSSNGNFTGTRQGTPTFVPAYVVFYVIKSGVGSDDGTLDINSYSASATAPAAEPELIEVIRIEEKSHFYDNSYTSLYIGNIRQIEWSFDGDHHFNLVRIGYNKWESEAASGLDDPQTKREFSTRFKKAGQGIDLYSSFIAAGLTFEQTRRTSKEKSADYKYDNDIFILSIRPDPVEISPETSPDVTDYEPELDENFDSITGLLNSESRYNLRLTPARNLIRWLNYLSGCLYKYLISTFSFASGEGNYDMTSELTDVSPDCGDSFSEVSESGNFAVSNEPLFIPKLIEMTIPLTWEHYMTIRQYRKNPIGISQSESDYTNLFIKDLSFKPAIGQATITGWPDEDFELVVPEDTFRGQVCFTYPTTEECAMLTEESETMVTEDDEIMILEECEQTSDSIALESGDDILLETGDLILQE